MNMYNPYSYELYHHGILGQKWGVRKYQYEDGSLTPEGRKRYGLGDRIRDFKEKRKEKYISKKMESGMSREESEEAYEKHKKAVKTTLLVVGGITIAAAVGYAAYKSGQNKTDSMINSSLGDKPFFDDIPPNNPPTYTVNDSSKFPYKEPKLSSSIHYKGHTVSDIGGSNNHPTISKRGVDTNLKFTQSGRDVIGNTNPSKLRPTAGREAPWNISDARGRANKIQPGETTMRNRPIVVPKKTANKPEAPWNNAGLKGSVGSSNPTGSRPSKYGDSLRNTTKALASDKANLASQAEELRRRNEMLKRSLGK